MKSFNYFLLILFALLALGCGETADEKQQALEIEALTEAVNNSSNLAQLASQLPANCAGTFVENDDSLLIACLFEEVQTLYLVSDPALGANPPAGPTFANLGTLDFAGLSCDLSEDILPQGATDVTIAFFTSERIIADLSTGNTPRFVRIDLLTENEVSALGVPCTNFLFFNEEA